MGTRGSIQIQNDFSKETLVTIYTQHDGYPSGLGMVIKNTLNDGNVEIINGISGGARIPTHFNGMGCLAAYLVGQMKGSDIGGIYLHPIGSTEEYNYTLYAESGKLYMTVDTEYDCLYNGLLSEFDPDNLRDD